VVEVFVEWCRSWRVLVRGVDVHGTDEGASCVEQFGGDGGDRPDRRQRNVLDSAVAVFGDGAMVVEIDAGERLCSQDGTAFLLAVALIVGGFVLRRPLARAIVALVRDC
jgi:hypothetical protein